ncbi:MAG: pseudouridine synthase [Gammaproteobacteria bacterium]|nr:pseudouridine synthase [Gammaproteobacteria bacterium]
MSEKLQKVLASHGLGSRRQMEKWIVAGRVVVNGQTATIGDRVDATDQVAVDGRRLVLRDTQAARVLVMNKREGVICTRRDPQGRETVFDALPGVHQGRWLNVGRLDINSGGLLLLTTDGTLAHRLTHPSTGIDREYAVRVNGELSPEDIERLLTGVDIDGETRRFSDVRYYDGSGRNHWYHVVLMEGRNHEVRDLFASQGRRVSRLKRVRYGPVVLPSWLRRGQFAEMGPEDLATLYGLLRLPITQPATSREGSSRSLLIPYPELPVQA